MSISAGKQIKRIQIMALSHNKQPDGGFKDTLVEYWSTFAEVKPLRNDRTQQGNQERLRSGYTFKVRYRTDKIITNDKIIIYNGVNYLINGVENVNEENKELLITGITEQI